MAHGSTSRVTLWRPASPQKFEVLPPQRRAERCVVAERGLRASSRINYATTMSVRFRQVDRHLQVSLVETRRVGGEAHHEHVASLGSIATPWHVADRIDFWLGLHERLGRLSNRLGPDAQAKVLGAVHERVPMVARP